MDSLSLKADLSKFASTEKACFLPRFFNSEDKFIGVSVPDCRLIARKYKNLPYRKLNNLLRSKFHEERLVALIILIEMFRSDPEKVYKFYLRNTKYINNWDLVDLSCNKIIGQYLHDKPRDLLYKLALSKDIWERRIAIVSTYTFIKIGQYKDTVRISKILLEDKHHLIHKAVGWMLRELGKKDEPLLIKFLKDNYSQLPRTTLRYAIERFTEDTRKKFLKGLFF